MTIENKSKKTFAKIIIGVIVIILAIGVFSYLKSLNDAFIADKKGRIAVGEILAICKAEQDYKSKTGNFTNDFADLNKDFGVKGNIKETDSIVITLDAPMIYVSSKKNPNNKRSFNMDKCDEPLKHFKLMNDKS